MLKVVFVLFCVVAMVKPVRASHNAAINEPLSLIGINLVSALMAEREPFFLARLGLSFTNRAIAKSFADYYLVGESRGYVAAAVVDVGAIVMLEEQESMGSVCNALYHWAIPGAFLNAFNHFMLSSGYAPETAELWTSAAAGLVLLLPIERELEITFKTEVLFRIFSAFLKTVTALEG